MLPLVFAAVLMNFFASADAVNLPMFAELLLSLLHKRAVNNYEISKTVTLTPYISVKSAPRIISIYNREPMPNPPMIPVVFIKTFTVTKSSPFTTLGNRAVYAGLSNNEAMEKINMESKRAKHWGCKICSLSI